METYIIFIKGLYCVCGACRAVLNSNYRFMCLNCGVLLDEKDVREYSKEEYQKLIEATK